MRNLHLKNSINSIGVLLLVLGFNCHAQRTKKGISRAEAQQAIIAEFADGCAHKYNLNTREWQECLDAGLQKDSTIAYLWQQKAMPLFKARKYETGMVFIDKAVQYDADGMQPYRAFIKCIFAKTYRAAIVDFEACKARLGNQYEMDHTYDFYIGLSYLQLNEYAKAEAIFEREIAERVAKQGPDWAHHLDLFYYGISKYEQQQWAESITILDRALAAYPEFSDAAYYKAVCLHRLGKAEEAKALFAKAKANAEKGYTINEDNAVYELYPYQIRWK